MSFLEAAFLLLHPPLPLHFPCDALLQGITQALHFLFAILTVTANRIMSWFYSKLILNTQLHMCRSTWPGLVYILSGSWSSEQRYEGFAEIKKCEELSKRVGLIKETDCLGRNALLLLGWDPMSCTASFFMAGKASQQCEAIIFTEES